jgi:hypothetical protein
MRSATTATSEMATAAATAAPEMSAAAGMAASAAATTTAAGRRISARGQNGHQNHNDKAFEFRHGTASRTRCRRSITRQ